MWATDYRPKTFEQVVGQPEAISVLKNSVGKASTFILHGDSGVGKTTLARIFADYINGEAIEINGADNNGVDDIRGLISSASYIPAFNDYRVFIIDECHMLTTAAWNALLKILEESPKSTLWMLCTTEYAKVPATIKSRSTVIALKKIPTKLIAETLINIADAEGGDVGVDYKREVVDDIARWSNGRLREAIVQFETYINTGVLNLPYGPRDTIELLVDAFEGRTSKVVKKLDTITNEDVLSIIRFINDYMKLLLLRHELPSTVSTADILDNYTDIGSAYLEELRQLQASVWKVSDGQGEQWRVSLDVMYNFYDKMMKHYNDFRNAKEAISIAILHTIGETYD